MKFTLTAWWCGCGQKNYPDRRKCINCSANRIERHAQPHVSERAVIYYNPVTGERKTPPRADMDMPARYAEQGFERQEIMSMVAFERETGLIHEPTNFNSGNEDNGNLAVYTPPPNREAKEAAIKDFAEGLASGPLTGVEAFLQDK
jgi:hypothetical protein